MLASSRSTSLRPGHALALASLAGLGCGPGHTFVSPTAPQRPPPFLGPSEPVANAPAAEAPPPTPQARSFFKTQDSNEWVTRAFKVQARYSRVIVVSPDGRAPAKISAGKLDLNGPPGAEQPVELAVDRAVATLAEAAALVTGGELVAVLPGRYAGFSLGAKPEAGDERFIHIKALGAPGEVIIDAPAREDRNWMIDLSGAHHVIIQGFNLAGSDAPGDEKPRGPNAGIFISGDFLRTSSLAHHLAVVGNYSHHHAKWGIHSVESHTVLVQDNLFGFSAREHGAYFSDGSDDYVIRRNVFVGSHASGLQVNLDPLASLEKVARHRSIEHPPMQPTRAWALGLLALGEKKFGGHAFPDGRGFNFIIEDNVVNGNGRAGGAAINLAGVRESLIQNNLVYGNLSTGIAEWDNGNPFDAAQVAPGPQSAAEVTGADVLPIFGCFNNVVRNNTVLMAVPSRPALSVGNGSWGTRAYNNILINDEPPSIELVNTSIWRFDGHRNVLDRVRYEGPAAWLKALAISLPDGAHSATGVKRSSLRASFVRPGDAPWALLDARWWRLNPARPDYHPRTSAALLAGRGESRNMPRHDIDGKPRARADIGAYVAVP